MLLSDAYERPGGIAQYNRDFLAALNACPLVESVRAWPRNIDGPIGDAIPEAVIYERRFAGGKARYAANALASILSLPSCDLVICAHLHLLPLAWLAAKRRGAMLALIIYGVEAWRPTQDRITDFLTSRIDRLISISRITEARFRDWSQTRAACALLSPGVDFARFSPAPAPETLATRYGVRGRPVMMTMGRLAAGERYKGVDELIELTPRLLNRIPELRYIVVGDGDDRARLEQKARALGVADNVIFAGHISEAEKADHFRLADLFVLPSRGEGFGIVLIEALASGAKAIGGECDGTREALLDGRLGALVDPASPEALYEAIVAALAAPSPRRRPPAMDVYSQDAFKARVADWLGTLTRPQ